MIDQKLFHECLLQAGVELFTGVPDTLLNDFCLYAEANLPSDRHVIAANEGNAVALAAGYHLATGSVPLVYMQNSGIGNSVNPLLSLTNKEVYSIPMVLLIGWRGDPAVADHPQHQKQGETTLGLLEVMGVPYRVLKDDLEDALSAASWAVDTARELSAPTVLIAKKGVLTKAEKDAADSLNPLYAMSREEAIRCVVRCVPEQSLFVATTGRAARELHALREETGVGHGMDVLNVGAMGHCSSIAAGIALAAKDRLVVCLDGDASVLMHMGALTTVGKLALPNYLHVLLNNGAHESVGGQSSAGFSANLTEIAHGAGYLVETPVETETDLCAMIQSLCDRGTPAFIEARIRKGIRSDLPPLKADHPALKKAFLKTLGA